MLTDEIIVRAKGGDIEAFENIVSRYEKRIFTLAMRYVKNEADACDMAQEAFLRIWRGLPSFEMNSGFSTWVHRITVNVCIDFLRKEKRNRNLSTVFLDDDNQEQQYEHPDERYEPGAIAERREALAQFESALSELGDEYRVVLVMRELNGLSYSEIAETLSIKEGTVKSRISRARERVRIKLLSFGNFTETFSSNKHKDLT